MHGFVHFVLFQITIQEFSEHRDADEARYQLDGRDVDGSRIVVEFAKGVSCLFNYMISDCYSYLIFCYLNYHVYFDIGFA
jgi:hypothetical protein